MVITQTDVFPTELDEATVVTIREVAGYDRVLSFQNLSGVELAVKIQRSVDNVTWTTLVASFTLDDGEIVVELITDTAMLRVLASGVSADRGLQVSCVRHLDTVDVWASPIM